MFNLYIYVLCTNLTAHDTAATHGCRMRRTTSGTITSDNYPKEYANDVDSCTIIDADEVTHC